LNDFLDRVAGLDQKDGDARLKSIVRKVIGDLFAAIDQFEVTPEEFWSALDFLAEASRGGELGLWAPGLGFERFLDLRMDEADVKRGFSGGTPRAIEGPLYVPGAPLSKGEARLDDGTEGSGEVLIMHGLVRDVAGKPIPGAIVDVWHANTAGNYSTFDPTQPKYNFRRRLETDADGAYKFRSIVPSGYAAPPGGTTDRLLKLIGRHARRPAHIHFFVSADGHRHLTTQVNISGDAYLHDDFAYATRNGLIPDMVRQADPEAIKKENLPGPFADIRFDFVLQKAGKAAESQMLARMRTSAA
jgi:catechol 1,2-dioxygenase